MSGSLQPAGQHVVVYEKREAKKGPKTVAYDTVYTDDQAKAGVVRCVGEHGKGSRVRCVHSSQIRAS